MAKIPFGDPSSEPYIDRRANAEPLLAEIAQCAFDAVPMRPALASWFYEAWRGGRISVMSLRGRTSLDSPRDRAALLVALKGFSGAGIEDEIQRLRRQFNIQASVDTIHGWRRDLKNAEEADFDAWAKAQDLLNIERFKRLAAQGIIGDEAIGQVISLLDPSEPSPNRDALLKWQEIAEYELEVAKTL